MLPAQQPHGTRDQTLFSTPPNLVCCRVVPHSPTCPELESQGGQAMDNTPSCTGKTTTRSCALSCLPSQSRPCLWGIELSSKSISGISQKLLKCSHFPTRHKEKLCWSTCRLQQNPSKQHPGRRPTQCCNMGDEHELIPCCPWCAAKASSVCVSLSSAEMSSGPQPLRKANKSREGRAIVRSCRSPDAAYHYCVWCLDFMSAMQHN